MLMRIALILSGFAITFVSIEIANQLVQGLFSLSGSGQSFVVFGYALALPAPICGVFAGCFMMASGFAFRP